jgi:hypothetical protein
MKNEKDWINEMVGYDEKIFVIVMEEKVHEISLESVAEKVLGFEMSELFSRKE